MMDAEERIESAALEALPDSILMHCILPLLDVLSLGRVACCSRRLSEAAVVDHLWYPICRSMHWFLTQHDWRKLRQRSCKATAVPPAPEPWQSWHHLFSFKLNRRCVECRELTPYVYTLSNSHFSLCERCEHACPKYALVTELEAKARYFLKDEDLQGLPHKKVCHKRFCIYFFLKTDIESISLIKGVAVGCEGEDFKKGKEVSHINEQKMHLFTEGELEDDQACMQMMTTTEGNSTIVYNSVKDLQLQTEVLSIKEPNKRPINVCDGSGTSFDATHGDARDKLEAMLGGNDACERACKKELRKEHKRQVKAAKREKRNLCSTETTFLSSSPDTGRENPQMADNQKVSKSRSTHMVYPSIQGHRGSVQSLLEPQSVNKEKSKKMKWRTKREHVKVCTYSQSETMDCNLKWKSKSPSDWVREREWLEVELGPYGLSALELQEL